MLTSFVNVRTPPGTVNLRLIQIKAHVQTPKYLYPQRLFWAGTNSKIDEPFFYIRANNIGMVLLQIVKAGFKLYPSAVLEALCKAVGKCGLYQCAGISHEQQFRARGSRQSPMRFLHRYIHIRRLFRDRQIIRQTPCRQT